MNNNTTDTFKLGDLIKRKTASPSSKTVCIVVDRDALNYTLYNNSLKCLQTVATIVIDDLYSRLQQD